MRLYEKVADKLSKIRNAYYYVI